MKVEDRKLWEEALAIIDDNLEIIEGGIIGNRFATASEIVEFAQAQVKKLTVPVVSNNEVAVCEHEPMQIETGSIICRKRGCGKILYK